MTSRTQGFGTFNRWLIFNGVVLFGAFLLYREGLFAALLQDDRSRLSLAILLLFLYASLRAGMQAWRLGREGEAARRLGELAAQNTSLFTWQNRQLLAGAQGEAASIAHQHLLFVAHKNLALGRLGDQGLLVDRLEQRLRAGHEDGWFIADLLIRLGLLGTVIGFILMLGSLADVESVDLQALQRLLGDMTGGMRIALYTTLTGLGAGMLLSFQYRLLDHGAERLLADIVELTEVHAAPHLRQLLHQGSGED